MQFAYLAPRKTSNPSPFLRSANRFTVRRKQIQLGAIIGCAVLFLIFLFSRTSSSSPERILPGTPEVVVVTAIDAGSMSTEYIAKVKENRQHYAKQHGYTTFFPDVKDYDVGSSPKSWTLIPSLRHAMTNYPHSTWFFALSPHALIMNPSLSLNTHITDKNRVESLMLKDRPVVPPDSVIKTFSHLKGDRIDLILTQDKEGLCQGSFLLKQGDWAQFFLDTWFDPLYKSYNFQKAEGHALEHIVQWHPTILAKLALVEQRLLNAYGTDISSRGGREVMYQDGDFIVRFVGCDSDPGRNCANEMEPFYNKWKDAVGS